MLRSVGLSHVPPRRPHFRRAPEGSRSPPSQIWLNVTCRRAARFPGGAAEEQERVCCLGYGCIAVLLLFSPLLDAPVPIEEEEEEEGEEEAEEGGISFFDYQCEEGCGAGMLLLQEGRGGYNGTVWPRPISVMNDTPNLPVYPPLTPLLPGLPSA
ncbi:hypothetical protein NQZ68_013565 [Dissostichus eleginoides]|nr:hypothetical protein NQZ68_013565 [Dissostichus eleginoides]